MPIEFGNVQWPPTGWRLAHEVFDLHDAWYSGDASRLAQVYGNQAFNPYEPQSSFWARDAKVGRRVTVHVPVAGDLSATSSALLFSEHPKFSIPGADDVDNPDPEARATYDRLGEIIEAGAVWSRVSAAAETCSAMGGVFLKVNWDSNLADYPILSVVQADAALPEFQHGVLTAVTFHKVLEDDGSVVWRLLERHERGCIYNGLFKGTPDRLGSGMNMRSRTDTAHLIDKEVIATGVDDLLCRYVPNMRPNRKMRRLVPGMNPNCVYLGQSDYSGSETLMESLDEVFTSLLRDIRLGAGRIIVPGEMIEKDENGRPSFNYDHEIFRAFDAPPSKDGGPGITVAQFAIRTQEHLDAANGFYRQIVGNAGYSSQTFGLDIQGRAESGTALNVRESKSLKTSAKKADYWKPALEDLFYMMLQVDRLHLGGKAFPIRPVVEMQDSIKTGITDIAPSVEMLARAGALSTETMVRMIHPDWDNAHVRSETDRLGAPGAPTSSSAS